MIKLLITEITRMGPAFCVIGLQRENEKIQSIRPVPSFANGWTHFPHQRGDILECALTPFPGAKPHVEDRVSTRGFKFITAVPEAETVVYLRKSELARSLPDLFDCRIHENKKAAASSRFRGMPNARSAAAKHKICAWNFAPTNSVPRLRSLPEKSCEIFPLSTATGATSSMPLSLSAAAPIVLFAWNAS